MYRNPLLLFILIGLISVIVLMAASPKEKATKNTSATGSYQYCSPGFDPDQAAKGNAPIIKGLGNLHYPISTNSKKAQQYFDQGLTLVYAFNYGEAARSFREVVKLDPNCAMGYWGIALVLGPNYNAPLDANRIKEIDDAISKAKLNSERSTIKEQALIQALGKRYSTYEVEDRTSYNRAYAEAMQQVYRKYPDDIDIAALYADALMNEHPWDLWTKDGQPQPWTPEIQSVLEKAIAKAPNHPAILHFYIHTMEASRIASKALPAADKLGGMLPAAGHLVHMPSHIYIRTGLYHQGVIANEKASQADSNYIAQCKVNGLEPMLYYQHNIHFLAACAFLEGNSKKAIDASWAVSNKSKKDFIEQSPEVQHFASIPYFVMIHLGKWDDILALSAPTSELKYPTAVWQYARGMAYANTGQMEKAQQTMTTVQQYAMDDDLKGKKLWGRNSLTDLIRIAALTLGGEILAKRHSYDEGITVLKEAVAIEDQLNYMEPPDWFFSVRHSLGHVLLQAKRYDEAEKVYREDLVNLPENGWALMGLYKSLSGQGKTKEAEEVHKRFDNAWQWADIQIASSRMN